MPDDTADEACATKLLVLPGMILLLQVLRYLIMKSLFFSFLLIRRVSKYGMLKLNNGTPLAPHFPAWKRYVSRLSAVAGLAMREQPDDIGGS